MAQSVSGDGGDSDEIRRTAERLLSHIHLAPRSDVPAAGTAHTHSIPFIAEEFFTGYHQDGQMSVVRRFFCLFVAFDLIFVSFLWLICAMLTGDSVLDVFRKQILHYSFRFSLFDVEAAAIMRFAALTLSYGALHIRHWSMVALTTASTCVLLIAKVFVFDWIDSKEQIFQVLLILVSFVLSWSEVWYLDYRVLPQELRAERILRALAIINTPCTAEDTGSATVSVVNERSPLLPTTSSSTQMANQTYESGTNYYSPSASPEPSAAQLDQENEEYHQKGLNSLREAYNLLVSTEWQVEKVTKAGDTIYSMQRAKLGKVFKLTARIDYPAKALIDELFHNVANIPKWNPTLLESHIVREINSYTDISYQVTASSAGGLVKSRDFVNLRSYRLMKNGDICSEIEDVSEGGEEDEAATEEISGNSLANSVAVPAVNDNASSAQDTLNKCSGAKDFGGAALLNEPPPLSDDVCDDEVENLDEKLAKLCKSLDCRSKSKPQHKLWITSAVSVENLAVPVTPKYTRGENIVASFSARKIRGNPESCVFEWLLAIDMKGYIPRYVLDTAYTTFMGDYMKHLRSYVEELRLARRNALP